MEVGGPRLRELLDDARFEVEAPVPLGSWRLALRSTSREYARVLGSLLRQEIPGRLPAAVAPPGADAEILLVGAPAGGELFPRDAADRDGHTARWETGGDGVRTLYTGWLRVALFEGSEPRRIAIFVREPQYGERAFRDHLFEILCKILFVHDRYYVHAGAVRLGDDVNVFVGPGSFGKSTICLRLAREGATILSEDHVVLRRAGDEFLVSGCQDTARVTPKTEAFLFGEGLDRPAVAGPGGPKKQFRVEEFFPAAPYVDFPFRRLFFNRVGERFHVEPIARRDAALRLIHMTRFFFRHVDPGELEAYLGFFTDLVAGRECYDLELSPDLGELDRLVEMLRP